MSKLIKIAAGIAAAAAAITLAAPAHADAWQDQEFYRLLTRPNQDYPMVIWNFPLVRAQGIAACQRMDAGETSYQALKDLQYSGPYPFEAASSIASAAVVIYCRWHLSHPVDVSAPVYPPPVYPPLAWYPLPAY